MPAMMPPNMFGGFDWMGAGGWCLQYSTLMLSARSVVVFCGLLYAIVVVLAISMSDHLASSLLYKGPISERSHHHEQQSLHC